MQVSSGIAGLHFRLLWHWYVFPERHTFSIRQKAAVLLAPSEDYRRKMSGNIYRETQEFGLSSEALIHNTYLSDL